MAAGTDSSFVVRNSLIVNTAFSCNSTGIYFSNILFGNTTTANNAAYLNGVAASGYQTTAGLSSNVAGLSSNNAAYLGGTIAGSYALTSSLSSYQTTAGLSGNVAGLSSNNAAYLNGVAAASYALTSGLATSATTDTTNANNISSGTLSSSRLATNILFSNVADQAISGGANVTAYSIGIVSSGTTTIDCGKCPLQYLTCNGAFTLAAPTSDGSCVVLMTNGTGAGAVANSGFTNGTNVGDALDTTNAHKFMWYIVRINGTSTFTIKSLQ